MLNLRKFYTGMPCKNGHLTYRYTQSGVCKDCLHPPIKYKSLQSEVIKAEIKKLESALAIVLNFEAINLAKLRASDNEALAQLRINEAVRAERAMTFVPIKFRAAAHDIEFLSALMLGLTRARQPDVSLIELFNLNQRPTNPVEGLGVYAGRCHPDDVDQIHAVANSVLHLSPKK